VVVVVVVGGFDGSRQKVAVLGVGDPNPRVYGYLGF